MVGLITALQAAQDRDCVLSRWFADEHLLEAALQRRVLLDPLPVFVQGGRADHPQLATGQHRLEHVARVHRPFRGACAHYCVQFVDERDDLAVAGLDLVQHRLQALLELTPVLGPGDHRAQVEGDQPLAAQRFGHVTGDDPLGKSFDHRGLADARLADQHRVVLGSPGQDLDHPADLRIPADDRVQRAVPGQLGQVDPILLQRLVGPFRVLSGDTGVAAHFLERVEQHVRSGAHLAQQGRRLPAVCGEADEQMLGGHVLIVQSPGSLGRRGECRQQRAGHVGRAHGGAGRPGQPGQQVLRPLEHGRRVHPDRPQQRCRGPPALLDQGSEQMEGVDVRVAAGRRTPDGV